MASPQRLFRAALLALLLATLSACSYLSAKLDDVTSGANTDKADYKKSKSLPSLEVPPDLTSSTIDDSLAVPDIDPGTGTAFLSTYTGERQDPQASTRETVLTQVDSIEVKRDGDKRWLLIKGEPEQVYPRVREFWAQNGILLKEDNPRIGIMETDWIENRADIPQDPVRKLISKAFANAYSSDTRDKFRVRVERGVAPGTTELYLTHRGVEEVLSGRNNETTVFQPRATDPELEAEMLNRVVVFFGVDQNRAKTLLATEGTGVPRAQVIRDANGNTSLSLDEDFSRAWQRTGLALDRVGFTVEDRDRSKGLYYVRYADPLKDTGDKGILSKLAFWKDEGDQALKDSDQYQISVIAEDAAPTRIVVLNKAGAPEQSDTSTRILTLLDEQLK